MGWNETAENLTYDASFTWSSLMNYFIIVAISLSCLHLIYIKLLGCDQPTMAMCADNTCHNFKRTEASTPT